jgi:hypothetical protein
VVVKRPDSPRFYREEAGTTCVCACAYAWGPGGGLPARLFHCCRRLHERLCYNSLATLHCPSVSVVALYLPAAAVNTQSASVVVNRLLL